MPDHLAGSCTTLKEGLDLYLRKQPTFVIATQLLEEGSGLDLIQRIKDIDHHVRTLLFLQHDNLPLLQQAVRTHSDGIVLESEMGSGHVITAIRTISKGAMYLEPKIAKELSGTHPSRDPGLTAREIEIMHHVVHGRNDREIGEAIHISTDTVKYHLKQVYSKLSLHNRTRAAITLVLMGLVEPPRPLIPGREDTGTQPPVADAHAG